MMPWRGQAIQRFERQAGQKEDRIASLVKEVQESTSSSFEFATPGRKFKFI